MEPPAWCWRAPVTWRLARPLVGDWQLLQKIDASATTGKVIITGATSFIGTTNAFATGTNPGWLFGSDAGLLDDTGTGAFNLTSVALGSGLTIVDVSSASAAQVANLTTGPGTGVTVSAGDEIIVQNSVATTTSTATFAHITGFDTLGIGGPTAAQGAAGTINKANLPGSINTIIYQTVADGSVTITNQVSGLTVNVEDNSFGSFGSAATQNLTSGAPGGLNDSFNFIIGNPLHDSGGSIGDVVLSGDEVVTFTALGQVSGLTHTEDVVGGLVLTPTLGGNEQVTIAGDTDLVMGATTLNGAITDVTGTVLNVNNLTVTITNTGVDFWFGAASGPLVFQTDPANAPFISYSSNAVTIDAHASGGLITANGDANFVFARVKVTSSSARRTQRAAIPSPFRLLGARPGSSSATFLVAQLATTLSPATA